MKNSKAVLQAVVNVSRLFDDLGLDDLNETMAALEVLYAANVITLTPKPKQNKLELEAPAPRHKRRNRKDRVLGENKLRDEGITGFANVSATEFDNLARNLKAWRRELSEKGLTLATHYRKARPTNPVIVSPASVINLIKKRYSRIQHVTMKKLENLTGISSAELLKRHA